MTIRCTFIEATDNEKIYAVYTERGGEFLGFHTSTEIREHLTGRDPDSDPEVL